MKMYKKIKYKNLDKISFEIYLSHLSEFIGRFLKEDKGRKFFRRIINNFTEEEQKIFWESLYLFTFLEEVEKLREAKYSVIKKEIEEKCLKEGRSEKVVFEWGTFRSKTFIPVFNKGEENKIWNLKEKILEAEKEKEKLYKEIEAIPKDKLLFIFEKIFSSLTDWQYKQNLIQLIGIKNFWLREIEELSLKPEFKNIERKNAKTQRAYINELLKILTGKNLEEYKSNYLEGIKKMGDYDNRVPLYIDLNKELDLKKLNYNQKKYWIETPKMRHKEFGNILDELIVYKPIHIYDKREERQISLREYYEENIDNFSQQTLLSKDLLDQIFVIYVIKRAQNGDKKAIEKLYNCYVKVAHAMAVKIIKRKHRGFGEGGELSYDNIKSVASSLLWKLLGGDRLEELPHFLKYKLPLQDQLTRRIDRKILEMYNKRFLQLELEIIYFWNEWKKFRKKIKNLRYNLKKSIDKNNKDSITSYLFKICVFSLKHLHILDVYNFQTSISFDPYIMLSASPKFNSFTYIHKKKSNLTTWLFGEKEWWETLWGKENSNLKIKSSPQDRKGYRGILWERLSDWYKSVTYVEKGERLIKKEDLASLEGIISYTKTGERKSQSKEEFLEDFSKEVDTIPLEESEKSEGQESEEEW